MTLLAFLLALSICPMAWSQQSVTYGQDQSIPTFSPNGADHGTLAVNSYGDVFVAYQGTFGGNRHMVEGMLLHYTGNDQWETAAANHLILGDMSLHHISLDESCSKPDIVELPDGSFCVAWHRIDRTGVSLSRLEVARIVVRDALGVLLPAPLIEQKSYGEGYIADGGVLAGFAGIMVDLVNLRDGTVAAVYAHETSTVNMPNGDTHREYDLRLTRIDWNVAPTDPNFSSAPVTLLSNIPIDNTTAHPLVGGQVLPDIVIDDLGNLVIAHEEYWLDGHGGIVGSNLGQIVLKRYAAFSAAAPLLELDSQTFTNNANQHQRRPNLATSTQNNRMSVSLTWVDDELVPFRTNSIHSREIDYSIPGSPLVRDLFWQNRLFEEDTHATIAHGPNNRRYTFGVRFFANSTKILVGRTEHADMVEFPTAVQTAIRPATVLTEFPVGSGKVKLFACYEGSDSGMADDYRVHIVIFRIP